LENLVDFLSSVIVLWRFYVPKTLTKDLELKLEAREERASILIYIILGMLGVFILCESIDNLTSESDGIDSIELVIVLSCFSIIVDATMATFKFHYSKRLNSPALFKDGVCSTMGTLLSIALLINACIIKAHPEIWYIDPTASFVGGLIAIFLGLQIIYESICVQKLPIWSLKWWLTPNSCATECVPVEFEEFEDYDDEKSPLSPRPGELPDHYGAEKEVV